MTASNIERQTTVQRQQAFLDTFASNGIIGVSATENGIPVGTVDTWVQLDTNGFKEKKRLAELQFLGTVEAEINRRAIEGNDKPLIFQGKFTKDDKGQILTYKEYSDNLLMFRAKKLDPSYRDNHVTIEASVSLTLLDKLTQASRPPAMEQGAVDAEVRELEADAGG